MDFAVSSRFPLCVVTGFLPSVIHSLAKDVGAKLFM